MIVIEFELINKTRGNKTGLITFKKFLFDIFVVLKELLKMFKKIKKIFKKPLHSWRVIV